MIMSTGNPWTTSERKPRNVPTQDQNNSVKRFNVQEIREALKRGVSIFQSKSSSLC